MSAALNSLAKLKAGSDPAETKGSANSTNSTQTEWSALLCGSQRKLILYMYSPKSFNWLRDWGFVQFCIESGKAQLVGIRWLLFVSLENQPFRIVGVEMSMVMNFPNPKPLICPRMMQTILVLSC